MNTDKWRAEQEAQIEAARDQIRTQDEQRRMEGENAVHADNQRRMAETENAIDRGRDEERRRRNADLRKAQGRRKSFFRD